MFSATSPTLPSWAAPRFQIVTSMVNATILVISVSRDLTLIVCLRPRTGTLRLFRTIEWQDFVSRHPYPRLRQHSRLGEKLGIGHSQLIVQSCTVLARRKALD